MAAASISNARIVEFLIDKVPTSTLPVTTIEISSRRHRFWVIQKPWRYFSRMESTLMQRNDCSENRPILPLNAGTLSLSDC